MCCKIEKVTTFFGNYVLCAPIINNDLKVKNAFFVSEILKKRNFIDYFIVVTPFLGKK